MPVTLKSSADVAGPPLPVVTPQKLGTPAKREMTPAGVTLRIVQLLLSAM